MSNPEFDPRTTKPGSAGWYEPSGRYHPFNCDLEPDLEFAARVKDLGARTALASLAGTFAASSAAVADQVRAVRSTLDANKPGQFEIIYYAPANIALGAGFWTVMTPNLDVSKWNSVSFYLENRGGAGETITYWIVESGIDPTLAYRARRGGAIGLIINESNFLPVSVQVGGAGTTDNQIMPSSWIRIIALSAAGCAAARVHLVGIRRL